jgi:hypothetical protein
MGITIRHKRNGPHVVADEEAAHFQIVDATHQLGFSGMAAGTHPGGVPIAGVPATGGERLQAGDHLTPAANAEGRG